MFAFKARNAISRNEELKVIRSGEYYCVLAGAGTVFGNSVIEKIKKIKNRKRGGFIPRL